AVEIEHLVIGVAWLSPDRAEGAAMSAAASQIQTEHTLMIRHWAWVKHGPAPLRQLDTRKRARGVSRSGQFLALRIHDLKGTRQDLISHRRSSVANKGTSPSFIIIVFVCTFINCGKTDSPVIAWRGN